MKVFQSDWDIIFWVHVTITIARTVLYLMQIHLYASRLQTFLCFLPNRLSSRLMWLNSRRRTPRGPFTVTVRPLRDTTTARKQTQFGKIEGMEWTRRKQSKPYKRKVCEWLGRDAWFLTYRCRGCPLSGYWEWSSFCRKQPQGGQQKHYVYHKS